MPRPIRILFIAAVGLSAALLFFIQPMAGKLMLPKLGGTPLVWNTCMLFFHVHLITREAVELYLRKLREPGLLAVHFSSSYVDLEPILDALTSELHLAGVVWRDRARMVPRQILEGKAPSTWAVLARAPARIRALGFPTEVSTIPRHPGAPDERFLWTDDYSNLIAAIEGR